MSEAVLDQIIEQSRQQKEEYHDTLDCTKLPENKMVRQGDMYIFRFLDNGFIAKAVNDIVSGGFLKSPGVVFNDISEITQDHIVEPKQKGILDMTFQGLIQSQLKEPNSWSSFPSLNLENEELYYVSSPTHGQYIQQQTSWQIKHHEHSNLILPPGCFFIYRQHEPRSGRAVID